MDGDTTPVRFYAQSSESYIEPNMKSVVMCGIYILNMYVYVYVCICVCVYICTHTCIKHFFADFLNDSQGT